jgi:hypothetical protein
MVMVEDDPSVMDLLQGRVIDVLGIIKEQRTTGDLDYVEMLEIRNFLNAELDREREGEKKHGNVNPGFVTRITDALVTDLCAACGEYSNAGLSQDAAPRKTIRVALNAFLPGDACAAMKDYLQARKKERAAEKC